jgi:hypothetical protein
MHGTECARPFEVAGMVLAETAVPTSINAIDSSIVTRASIHPRLPAGIGAIQAEVDWLVVSNLQ